MNVKAGLHSQDGQVAGHYTKWALAHLLVMKKWYNCGTNSFRIQIHHLLKKKPNEMLSTVSKWLQLKMLKLKCLPLLSALCPLITFLLSCTFPRALANTLTTTEELDEKEAFAAACSKSSNSSSSSSSNWMGKYQGSCLSVTTYMYRNWRNT